MDNSTYDNEFLLRYLDDELNLEERESLELKLAIDEELKLQIEKLKVAKRAVVRFGIQNQVKDIRLEILQENKVKILKPKGHVHQFIRYSVAVAASILLIYIGVEGYYFYQLSSDKIFKQNFQSYELVTTRSSESQTESDIEKFYREKNYTTVIHLSETGALSNSDLFLVALSNLELSNIPKAITQLQVVKGESEKSNTLLLKESADYYQALAYLKNNELEKALEAIIKIHQDPTHTFHKKASSKLIRKLKRLKWK